MNMTNDEKYYFGSFCEEFHGIKNIILWIPTSKVFNYILVSKNLKCSNYYKININDYSYDKNIDNIDNIDDIINFLKNNNEIIYRYMVNEIYLDNLIENIIKI